MVVFLTACSGTDVEQDFSAAKRALERATTQVEQQQAVLSIGEVADRGYAPAQVLFGYFLMKGQFVAQDTVRAARLFQEAAESGDPDGEYNLGLAYAQGMGLPKDLPQAAVWFLRSAEKGDTGAQFNLGLMYATGEGVGQDVIEAYIWLTMAHESGHKDAVKVMQDLQKHMSTSDMAKVERRLKRKGMQSSQ